MLRQTIAELIVLFFCYSVAGWCMEVTLKYIQFHRFINRGFLIGPYCPIYGSGAVVVTVLVGGLIGNASYIVTFLASFILCGVLEYFVSWYMEKMFHARWWDYSQKPMNLNGRIWIGNLILFGLASVAIIHWIDPVYFAWADRIAPTVLHCIAIAIVALMIADHALSHALMNIVRKEIDAQDGDNTEEISLRVHELLKNRSLLIRRIHQAYPELQARPRALIQQLHDARKEWKAAVREWKAQLRIADKARKDGRKLESEAVRRLESARAALQTAKQKFRTVQEKFRRRDELE